MLDPQLHRQLAAVILRGALHQYDRSPTLAHVVDSVIADLLVEAGMHDATSSQEVLATRLLHRYAYRLPPTPLLAKAA